MRSSCSLSDPPVSFCYPQLACDVKIAGDFGVKRVYLALKRKRLGDWRGFLPTSSTT